MVIRILLISLLLQFACSAMAQEEPTTERGSYFGITGGVGTVGMVGQHNYGLANMSPTPETTYTGGVVGGVTLKKGHTIHAEVVLSWQKYHYQDVRNVYGEGTRNALIGKDLSFVYFRVPLMYKRIMGIEKGDLDIGDSKFFWGAGVEIGALYDVELDYTVNGISDDRFVLNPVFNHNIEYPPANDVVLYRAMDVAVTGTAGWERFLTQHLVFQAELKGTASMLDINHEDWRIANADGVYTPSRHFGINFKCSFIYYVNKVKRLDVY